MFRVAARTILELGSELISSDIIAFYELIKNAFDARSESGVDIVFNIVLRRNDLLSWQSRITRDPNVWAAVKEELIGSLNVESSLSEQARELAQSADSADHLLKVLREIYRLNNIVVSDAGSGMSERELVDNFLVLGTASRKRDVDEAVRHGDEASPFLGEKGIGRLSAMRLGYRLRVETARRDDGRINVLEIDWSAFANLDAMLDEIEFAPQAGPIKPAPSWQGTRLVISGLSEDWTKQRVERMAAYDFARLTDPFLDQKLRPRVALFWNRDRLAIPWMNRDLIRRAHANISGSYEIQDGKPQLSCRVEAADLGFPHPPEVEHSTLAGDDLRAALIGTKQDIPEAALVGVGPFQFEAHWYNKRRLTGIESIGDIRAVRDLQERWSGILLFRDRFRIFPYGDDKDDWLALDRKALRRSGYALNKTQFIGRVQISRITNPDLVDQTNREGLRESPEQQVLINVIQFAIQDLLFRFMKSVERQYKDQTIDLTDSKTEIDRLQGRAKKALSRLRTAAASESDAIQDIEQALLEFSEFADQARRRIEQVEQESRQMVEMAGVGLMVEVVAHELARATENALANLDLLQGKNVPDEVKRRLESLRVELKSLSKRVRILDPLSVSGRQRTEVFNLDDLVRETIDAHDAQFARHQIRITYDLPPQPVRVRAVKGMIVQILENLISNSVYWLDLRRSRDKVFEPIIRVAVFDSPPTITCEDNGPGVAPENREKVFRLFFSLKEKAKRRGLGLFIARECAQYNDGSLTLDETPDPATGRLHRFTFELNKGADVR
jgi:signal transduction histidine kinase